MENDEWITASDTLRLLASKHVNGSWRQTIFSRLQEGLIRSKADTFVQGSTQSRSQMLDVRFWGRGSSDVSSRWEPGDFERRVSSGHLAKAFGVCFAKEDILAMLGRDATMDQKPAPVSKPTSSTSTARSKGGRPHEFDHWEAAATVAIMLSRNPEQTGHRGHRMTQASVEALLKETYTKIGRVPQADTLQKAAKGILRALQKNQ
ncbi:MAG: hypothetical protein ACMVO5_06070 [Polymorphobacter sp.]|uniref:hypothetical protein n=1 Tax=Polymorphobacter sp. TaxID=1909290 RepID=UPI003A84BA21